MVNARPKVHREAMKNYIPRTLTYIDAKGEPARISDVEIAAISEPVIVLGEPGMGKTWLLREISERANMVWRSAASFVVYPDPASLIRPGSKLIIDGLDELSAARESDPVYRVLGQLLRAGCPPFILSCRAADWRGAVARQDISEEYGVSPREVTLEPLSRDDAIQFLESMIGARRAAQIIDYLDKWGIPDLYGNPLTLNLFGEIASDSDLPKSRAELLTRACSIMWNERADRRNNSPLSQLDQESALAAAGVACATLVLTGSEAISLDPPTGRTLGLVHIPDLRPLPGGENVGSVVGSRLFASVHGPADQFKPIHRSIAEFLGARWLAKTAKDEETRERMLGMMTFDAGVPASLRGIHAWLPHFDPRFASQVIANDPYGVLRYGDADGLSVAEGRKLLQSLKRLQAENPYFRAEDWSRQSAKGLAQVELRDDIGEILIAGSTNFHLRTLLLEAIRGSSVADALANDLHVIMLNKGGGSFDYVERYDAAKALIELDPGATDWAEIVSRLTQMGDEDSTRLALEVIDDVGYVLFTDTQIAETVLGHLGLLERIDSSEERSTTSSLYFTERKLPDAQLEGVLDALAMRVRRREQKLDWHTRSQLADFVIHLVCRRLKLGDPDPLKLLFWLRITPRDHGFSPDQRKELSEYLKKAHTVRNDIQRHVMFVESEPDKLWSRLVRLASAHDALAVDDDDVVFFLHELANFAEPSDAQVEVWRELATFARRNVERADEIRMAAEPFARGKPELEEHLLALSQPIPPRKWEIEHERRRRRNERKKAKAWTQHRKDFSLNEAALRSGELRWSLPVSQAYLGLFHDTNAQLSAPDRIGEWLGPELQAAALAGLDAVLSRPDLPTLQQIVDSYAQSRRWNFVLPMLAGVAERVRNDRPLSELPRDLIIALRIALHQEPVGDRIDTELLAHRLEDELRREPALYERYVRLLIEPYLEAHATHIMGLYAFLRTPADRGLAHQLALEWLTRHSKLPVEIECELVDTLIDGNELEALREIARTRASQGFANDQHRRNWQAVSLLVDFETTAAMLGTIAADEKDLIWHLRECFGGERTRERPPPIVSPPALTWVIRQFRPHWPRRVRPSGMTSGDTNSWDATHFLESLVNRLSRDATELATKALKELVEDPEDAYTPLLLYAADQQRRLRRELNFPSITLQQLRAVIEHRAPESTADLLVIVRSAIARLQKELGGSDTDTVDKYYRDDGRPRDEDSCTDRLIEDIERLLPPYGIGRIPQRDMPADKRADIVFTIGDLGLPVECKGQWNASLWTATGTQLDSLYLRDWRAQDCGLYIVYWFGAGVADAYQLKRPPRGVPIPASPDELHAALTERIPAERRGSIAIEVLDLTR